MENGMKDHEYVTVGEVGNYYGGLCVKVENGKAFWSITDYDGDAWQEISEQLYNALRFEFADDFKTANQSD